MSRSPYRWGRRSLARLQTCTPEIQRLLTEALHHPDCPHDMTIVFGHRTHEEQAALYAKGRTAPGPKVTNARPGRSRHNSWPSEAVDVVPYVDGAPSWDWDHIDPCADHIKRVASELGIKIEWGGDWGMRDGAHWQEPRPRK